MKAPLLYDDYEILEPKSGVLELVDNQKIIFKIKNLSRYDNLSYISKSDVSTKINSVKDENNVLEFDIVYHKKDGRFIKLFVNSKAIAAFKIIPKSKSKI